MVGAEGRNRGRDWLDLPLAHARQLPPGDQAGVPHMDLYSNRFLGLRKHQNRLLEMQTPRLHPEMFQ